MTGHKVADTGCLGNPKINSSPICYLIIFGRMTLSCDSVWMTLRLEALSSLPLFASQPVRVCL